MLISFAYRGVTFEYAQIADSGHEAAGSFSSAAVLRLYYVSNRDISEGQFSRI